MKLKNPLLGRTQALVSAAVIVCSSSPLLASGTFNWSGGGANSGWPTTANWDSAITSDNDTNLVFNATTNATGMFIGGSRTVRSLSFGANIDSSIAASFNYYNSTAATLSMSSASGNASISVDGDATGNITLGFASGIGSNPGPLSLVSNLDVIHNGSGQLTFNRAVSGSNGITKTGTGTLAFTGGTVANTYSGLTTVSEGTLTLSKTAGTDAIAGNVLLNSTGTLLLGAANQIKDTANLEVASGTFSLAGYAETVNGVSLTGGTISGTSGSSLTSATALDLQAGTISVALAGSAGATKTGSGTVILNSYNSLTGNLNINDGKLIANTSGSAGQELNNFSAINLGGGTLEIRANFQSKNYATPPLTVNTASTLVYNNVNSANYTASFTGTGFVLNADLVVNNISDSANNNGLNLSRPITGSGNLTVSTFNDIAASSNSFSLGRVLLSGDNSAWTGDLTVAQGTISLSGTSVNAAGTGAITIGTDSDTFGAGITFFPTGPNGSTITYANNLTVESGGFRAIKGGGTDHSVKFTGNVTLNGDLTVDHTWATTDRRIWFSGNISGSGGLAITRVGGNAGTTASLSGANTYTGSTTVATGASLNCSASLTSDISVATGARFGGNGGSTTKTLTLASGAKFIFYVPTFAPFNVTGTVTLDSSFDVASLVGGSQGEAINWAAVPDATYTLIGTTASTFDHISNFGAANAASLGGGRSAYFQNGPTGGLQLVVETAGFSAWQTANSTSGGLDQDHDGDGVSNGVEYFMYGGASSTGFTSLPGIVGNSVTWVKAASGYSGTYGNGFVVQTSSTLAAGSWVTAAEGTGPDTVTVAGNNVTYNFPTTGQKKFARLVVTGP